MIGRRPCRREPDVMAALAASRMTAELETHVGGCAQCREAVGVARWMRDLAGTTPEPARLPDASTLWWKAQVVKRWEAERRSAAPVETLERAEIGAAIVVLALAALWGLPALWRSLTSSIPAAPEAVTRLALTTDLSGMATLLGTALLAFGVATFYVVHRTLFAEY